MFLKCVVVGVICLVVWGQECPRGWVDYGQSCYKFNRSPYRTRDGAKEACQAYNCELISVNTFEEHRFVVDWLREHDPQHRRQVIPVKSHPSSMVLWWFTSGFESGDNVWTWEGDNAQFSNIDNLWLPQQDGYLWKYVSYNFSTELNRWGLQKVAPEMSWHSSAEIPKERLFQIYIQERPLDFGYILTNREEVPQGPYFVEEPAEVIFDQSGRSQTNDISLRCVAEGNPPPYVQVVQGKSVSCDPPQFNPAVHYFWVRNAFPDFVQEDPRVFVSHDGNLYFSSLEKNDDANYSCNVQSRISSTGRTGPYFHLLVEPASSGQKLLFPNNFPKSFPEAPLAGNDVRLECIAYGYPVPKYNWTRVGGPMPAGAQISSHGRVLLLPSVRVEDLGEYVCIASADQDSIRKGVTLTIQVHIVDDNILVIEDLNRADEGMYQCSATNSLGTSFSTAQLRVVTMAPNFAKYPLDTEMYAAEEGNITIPCRPEAAPYPEFTWRKNGYTFALGGRTQGYRPGYLVIYNVSFAEAGRYTCIAKTSVGKVFSNTELLVLGPPGQPGAVLGHSFNATSGFIDNTKHQGRREVELGNVLSPWSKYEFRVTAANILGVGQPSDPSPQYNTAVDRPYIAPRNVGGGGGKAGSLTITWTPLSPEEWNSPEVWYRVYYRPSGDRSEPRKKDLRKLGNVGLYVVPVGEENYFSPYEVQLQAVNVVGEGPISEPEIVYSAEGMPQVQPSGVYAVPHNSTALNVTWTPLDITREKIRGRLIGHRIKYWRSDLDRELDSLILLKRGIENWGLIVGLQPNTEYRVAVMAYNEAGSGPESEFFVAKTFKAAPLRPPTSVKVHALSPTSVRVTWRGVVPSIEEESIQGYKVRYWEADQDLTSAKEVYKQLDGEDLEAVVSGLVPGKIYKLRVLAWSFGGDGKMSSPPWEFRVGDGAASPYRSKASITGGSMLLLWLAFLFAKL
ncbi:hypothetical protein HPB51_023291 [Rhipicephalus microplus]|uniref:Contactin n=1 Tax=Rhipicephalus microplus TaxID=6941 RepID=A0A9J6ECD2_RHIMP|nr:hypothetical protein HPB51_023291 [Rhipicephalus microplus]